MLLSEKRSRHEKDWLKNIQKLGTKMYRKGEIRRAEALSKSNYQSAVSFLQDEDIITVADPTDKGDKKEMDIYSLTNNRCRWKLSAPFVQILISSMVQFMIPLCPFFRLLKGIFPRINGSITQFFFYAKELIVFCEPLASRHRSTLDLSAVCCNGDIGHVCILRLTRPVGYNVVYPASFARWMVSKVSVKVPIWLSFIRMELPRQGKCPFRAFSYL